MLLGSPVLLAYGLEVSHGAPWYYYLVLPLFFLGFLLIPGSIGAIGVLADRQLGAAPSQAFLDRHRHRCRVSACRLWGVWWFREARELGVGSRTWFESLLQRDGLSGRPA